MTYRIEIDAPEVPYPGGTPQPQFMREAAKRIDKGHGMGSNLTATVVHLLNAIADAMEAQEPPRVPKFTLGAQVRFAGSPTEAGAWTDRRVEKHLGLVVENYDDGEVRVYDTVEHDWWMCDEDRLVAFEEEDQ